MEGATACRSVTDGLTGLASPYFDTTTRPIEQDGTPRMGRLGCLFLSAIHSHPFPRSELCGKNSRPCSIVAPVPLLPCFSPARTGAVRVEGRGLERGAPEFER